MAPNLDAIAERLFGGVMAPLVLGGGIAPGHAIGTRVALALGEGRVPADAELVARVGEGRVRRARRLVPIDSLPGPSAAAWALSAAFHDLLQSVNPAFDGPFRRSAAARILELAVVTLERVAPPASVGEVLSRHTWLARVPEIARTDAEVRWWAGRRDYRGVVPPGRLQAWPHLRRVSITRAPRPLLELTPMAVDRERLTAAVALLLAHTPLTDLATCTRTAPAFVWRASTIALVGTGPGRTLVQRALARLEAAEVDEALGRATRTLLVGSDRERAGPVVMLLAERAVSNAVGRMNSEEEPGRTLETTFAQAVGAIAARAILGRGDGAWSFGDRARLVQELAQAARSNAAVEARKVFEP